MNFMPYDDTKSCTSSTYLKTHKNVKKENAENIWEKCQTFYYIKNVLQRLLQVEVYIEFPHTITFHNSQFIGNMWLTILTT